MTSFVLWSTVLHLFFSIEPSYGWYEKGNGGDVLVCEDGVNLMYDFYEAQVRYGLQVRVPSGLEMNDGTEYSGFEDMSEVLRVAGLILDRARGQDVELVEALRERLRQFSNEVSFPSGVELTDVEDMGVGYLPRNCTLKQLILQRAPRFSNDARYVIALDYWKTLSLFQRSVGVVHEILYNYALGINPRTHSSEPIRYFNALLLADRIKSLSREEYRSLKSSVFLTMMENFD